MDYKYQTILIGHIVISYPRSPVLAAMSQAAFIDGEFDEPYIVDVPDVVPYILKELLRYIYTGEVPLQRMNEVAVELFVGRDKYLTEKLKKACGVSFSRKFILIIALYRNAPSLEENDPIHPILSYYLREKVDFCVHFRPKCSLPSSSNCSWKKASE